MNKVNNGIGFPKVLNSTLRYHETINLTSNAGSLVSRIYAFNGLYDPNASVGGHQPYYFDQLMGIYNHYYVKEATIKLIFIAPDGNAVPIRVCLWQNDDTVVLLSQFQTIAEQSKAVSNILGNGGDSRCTLSMKWSAAKTFGKQSGMSLLRGDASANPTETSNAVITIVSADGVSSADVVVMLEMEFNTDFSELRDIAGS